MGPAHAILIELHTQCVDDISTYPCIVLGNIVESKESIRLSTVCKLHAAGSVKLAIN